MNREEYLENKLRAAEAEIKRLQAQVDELQKRNAGLGWVKNPDTSGGAFTDWETKNANKRQY